MLAAGISEAAGRPVRLVSAAQVGAQSADLSGQVDTVLAANTPRFAGAVPSEAETLLEELTVFGTPAEARSRLSEWHAAGADMPMVFIRPNLSPEEIERTLSAFTPMLKSREGAP